MFTGIIEELGRIEAIEQKDDTIVMVISAPQVLSDVQLGDSIAVNGVCLTVAEFTSEQFTVEMMPETVKKTSLRMLEVGSKVNLERSIRSDGRFGGHFVSGHVDGIGKIIDKRPEQNAVYYDIELDSQLTELMVMKGSVAVDGTSLTIFGLERDRMTISLIPHTLEHTILGYKTVGDIVNIECDMIGKYVAKFMPAGHN